MGEEKGVGRCPGKILKFKNKKLHLKCSEDVHSIVLLPLLLTRNHIPEIAFEIYFIFFFEIYFNINILMLIKIIMRGHK